MKNRWVFIYGLILFALVEGACRRADAYTLTLLTQENAPRSFTKDGKMVGAATEQVFELMKRANIAYDVQIEAWSRAVSLSVTQANTCAYPALYTADRNIKYKWVGPLIIDPIVISRKINASPVPFDPERAKKDWAGTQKNSASYDLAVKFGFKNIETTTTFESSLRKLEAGHIDFAVSSRGDLYNLVSQGLKIEEVMVLDDHPFGLACSKHTPDDVIAKLNATLADMIKDGTQAKINHSYGF